MKTITTCVGLNAAGVPLNSVFAQKIQNACTQENASATSIHSVYSYLYGINKILQEAAMGLINWLPSETIEKEYPVYFIQEGLGDNVNSVTLILVPFEEVLKGNKAPEVYQESDGQDYYKVAKVEMLVAVGNALSYMVDMNVGVSCAEISPDNFNEIDWYSSLKEVLPDLIQDINQLFNPTKTTEENTDNKSNSISGPLSTVTDEVNVAMFLIDALKATKTAIEHYSYARLLMANFSTEAIHFNDVYTKDADPVEYFNTVGTNLDDIKGLELQAPIELSAAGQKMALVQLMALNLKSSKTLKGVGISLSYQSTGTSAEGGASMLKIPFTRDNQINTSLDFNGTANAFWDEGGASVKFYEAQGDKSNLVSSLALDYLFGKHPSSSGELAYYYSAINCISTTI